MDYLVYKVTNRLNGKVYIGAHQTEDLNDSYMGSGTAIQEAIKRHGLENFEKEILFTFSNCDSMMEKEAQLVTLDFVQREDTYNSIVGGNPSFPKGYLLVKDRTGRKFRVTNDDPRLLSGELQMFNVGNFGSMNGKVIVKDKAGSISVVRRDDPRYLSGELVHTSTGRALAIDKEGRKIITYAGDPRFKTGELKGYTKGTTISKQHKKAISKANKVKAKGKGNSQYGTIWITNPSTGENKKIKKDLFLSWSSFGWIKGRNINKTSLTI